jgi:hypothetical protein
MCFIPFQAICGKKCFKKSRAADPDSLHGSEFRGWPYFTESKRSLSFKINKKGWVCNGNWKF